jgi:DNA-directed RNA polymerase
MDGTCNGYQHLSAMGLDCSGGGRVNLVSGNIPRDLYADVADATYKRLQEVRRRNKNAADWLNLLSVKRKNEGDSAVERVLRQIAKHATMTIPYGSSAKGIAKWLVDNEYVNGLEGDPERRARSFASFLVKQVAKRQGAAKEIMGWLQNDVARFLGERDFGVHWMSPAGFPVVQEERLRRRRFYHGGISYSLLEWNPRGQIPIDDQVRAVVANLVHSFDAAHMILTVTELRKQRLNHFAMIHDSYGVHAPDIPVLNQILRKAFVRIYKKNVLENFWGEQCARTGLAIKRPPRRGNLRITKVLQAKYFFS